MYYITPIKIVNCLCYNLEIPLLSKYIHIFYQKKKNINICM